MTTPNMSQLEQERLLFRYSMALERGDFEAIESILETAANHPSLNRMIQELDAAYSTDIDSDPEIHGEYTMAQQARSLILPQKQKHAPQSRRSFLLFPFAATVALALVGLSLLSFNPPPADQGANQGLNPGAQTATPTPVPYIQPATGVRPSEVPSLMGPTIIPTVVPPFDGNPTLVPSVVGPTYTPTALSTLLPPTIVPPGSELLIPQRTWTPVEPGTTFGCYTVEEGDTMISISLNTETSFELLSALNPNINWGTCNFTDPTGGPSCNPLLSIGQCVQVPLPAAVPSFTPTASGSETPTYCEGITQGDPETPLFTRPFINETQGRVIGRAAPGMLVAINDMAIDPETGETWYYIGGMDGAVVQGDQGWTDAANLEMWSCAEALNPTPILTSTPFLMETPTETPTPLR